jgi:ElaB/YqjD/DUF883 family membrane-anchored ribosome-binding protein
MEVIMKPETLTSSFDQFREGTAEVVQKVKDLSAKAGQKLDTTYDVVVRGVRKIKNSSEEAIKDTRGYIKGHPLAVVAGTALGAFALGALAGYIVRARRSS